MKVLMCILVVLILAFVLGAIQWNQIEDLRAELEASRQERIVLGTRAERMIPSMERARDAHQYFVDNPDKAWWNVEDEQDADWVWIYNELIDILRRIR